MPKDLKLMSSMLLDFKLGYDLVLPMLIQTTRARDSG